MKKEDSKKAFEKEAVFKVPKIKGYPMIRIEKGCDFQRNTNFSYSSQPLIMPDHRIHAANRLFDNK